VEDAAAVRHHRDHKFAPNLVEIRSVISLALHASGPLMRLPITVSWLTTLPVANVDGKLALTAASDRSNSLCGWPLYSAFAEIFRAFRGIDFATRLRWLLDLLQPSAIAGGTNDFG